MTLNGFLHPVTTPIASPGSRLAFNADRTKWATISENGLYRYLLGRTGWPGCSGGNMLFVMLNPSTADVYEDDNTIRRCTTFAQREGQSAMEVVNLYAYRSTDPKHPLYIAGDQPLILFQENLCR
jgi:hypothetical protein